MRGGMQGERRTAKEERNKRDGEEEGTGAMLSDLSSTSPHTRLPTFVFPSTILPPLRCGRKSLSSSMSCGLSWGKEKILESF